MEVKKIDPEAAKKKKEFDPVRAIMIIIFFMLIVWVIWFFVSNLRSGSGKEVTKEVAKSDANLAKSSVPTKKVVPPPPPTDSFYKNYVKINKADGALETYPEKEYIEVRVVQTNLSAVDISDWKLVNSKGESAVIGNSAALPVGGKVNKTDITKVSGNDVLIISTGRSPVGVSFRLNSCTGYFEQFQDFFPPVTGYCPQPSANKGFQSLEQDCRTFVYTIPSCTTNIKPYPSGMSAGCKSFIVTDASYNGCVAANKDKADFYKTEWRLYLNKDKEMWAQPKDKIMLLDDKGNLVDTYSYGR
ncbi:MAG: hypothetical protein WCT49_06090 [Candidatus Paceibacterota bacterium]|jgi:hypothetical protein|nr:hypothetical protein [Candidatus Paceibacterota bacterium]